MTDWRLTLRLGEGEGERDIAAGGERSTTVTGARGNARRTTTAPATLAIPTNAVADPAPIIPPAPIPRTKSLAESDDCASSTTATTTATTPRASIAFLSMSDSGGNLSNLTNLDRFLEHTTPLVPWQQFSKIKFSTPPIVFVDCVFSRRPKINISPVRTGDPNTLLEIQRFSSLKIDNVVYYLAPKSNLLIIKCMTDKVAKEENRA